MHILQEFNSSGQLTADGFCDSDRGNDPDNRQTVTGYGNWSQEVLYRGHHDAKVLWHNQLLRRSMSQHVKHAWRDKVYATC